MFEIASTPILKIDIQQIDLEDERYRISIQKNFSLLCQSIQLMGVMTPPVIQEKASKYLVISGFQRIYACKVIGMELIPCHVVSSDFSEHDCARWAIAENASQRSLIPLEQSRALRLIETIFPEKATVLAVAQQMGLPSTQKAMHQIRPLCHMPQHIQDGIANAYIAIPIAHALRHFSENDIRCVANLFKQLNAGVNIQRELLSTCDEIAKRDNKSVADILNSDSVNSIMSKYADDRKQRIYYLRQYLKRLRYPTYTSVKSKVESSMKRLKLNAQTQLVPPPFFESDIWQIQINFINIKELKHSLANVLSRTDAINTIISQDIQI
jgi:ParB family chromosome partitioning protein